MAELRRIAYTSSAAEATGEPPPVLIENLLTPPVLFFLLGVLAVLVRSDLEIPPPVTKALALYLLFAIGFHGGVALHRSGVDYEVAAALAAAGLMAVIVPVYSFFLLRMRLDPTNAAALAAAYGSVSAVTFITAGTLLQAANLPYGGHMVAALAVMEAPAIIVAIGLLRRTAPAAGASTRSGHLLHDALFNGSVFLILGSLGIGLATGERGWDQLHPFSEGLFRGILAFFLLDMGILATRRVRDVIAAGWFLPAFALLVPLFNAALAIALARALELAPGDAVMLAVLSASASYIAVPAAMRLAIPDANPGLYLSTALGITFPFNIIFGIPLYMTVVRWWWG
jgi:uncharacterized protein